MARRYELRRRAERQQETRRRIVEAALQLHTSVGFSGTTDSGIAERAGVTRMTFYRHFPDNQALLRACTDHGMQLMPPPPPLPLSRIADPEQRLRSALRELYRYYEQAGGALLLIARDTPRLTAAEREVMRTVQLDHLRRSLPAGVRGDPFAGLEPPDQLDALLGLVYVLGRGWGLRGRRQRVLRGAISHAVAVTTWRSLVCEQGLTLDDAIELLVAMVLAAAKPA